MVPFRLICLSEVTYLLKTGCCTLLSTAPCFVIEFRNKDMTLALQATGITKRFPGVLANDHVNFFTERDEIHALLGENGAGKSMLMNILYGFYQPDEGTICIQDQPVKMTSPHDAIKKGVGMVHQHFMLVPPLTVTENIMLGQES